MKVIFVVGVLCLAGAGASSAKECMEPWNTLEHTFSPMNVARRLVKKGANTIPMSIIVPDDATCVNNVGTATYYGNREQVVGDVSNNIVGLYDIHGIIAGMQLRVNKSALFDGWTNTFRYERVPMYQTEENDQVTYFVLTAYFVDPSTICREGRTLEDLQCANATGYTLMFQNGPTPSDLLVAPRRRPEALQMGYSNSKCFPGMGNHSFYNVESYGATNCNEMTPVFLLHNSRGDGCLVGFGFFIVGKAKSDILEHFKPPSWGGITKIMGKSTPQCLNDLSKRNLLTRFHVFFTRRSIGCGGSIGLKKVF